MRASRLLVLAAAMALGCSTQVIGGSTAGTGAGAGTGGGSTCVGAACACGNTATIERMTTNAVNKIDIVLVVDNSASMADKQQILALGIPDLIEGLVNPPCLDDVTRAPVTTQPTGPLDACPAGSTREFPPVLDMHVGMLSSSLGTFGADGCKDIAPPSCPSSPNTPNDDHGHLVTRTDPCSAGTVPTYQSEGFLAWDPAQKLTPPGESQIGSTVSPGLVKSIHDLVIGDGELGCGFESQNESWYRFLVDPTPYQSISLVNNQVVTSGVDQVLLQQRAEFLRPDSLLLIVNVSDEDDTSIRETSSYPLFAAPELYLPHARQECATKGPKDPCCASCGQPTPQGCPQDPMCTSSPNFSMTDENVSIRAFGLITHKQRYGIEFFYQPSRYVQALTSATVTDITGKVVPNPIFSNLNPTVYKGAIRDPGLVFYAPIVGVPWQLLARLNASGQPDLINGVNALDPTSPHGGFKTAAELSLMDTHGNVFWDDIAGDPENYVPAKSPYMVESSVPRTGTDPITGIATSPPTSPSNANPINGHERTIAMPPGDIEYACIFPLLHPIDCSQQASICDCPLSGTTDNPLCNGTTQVAAKAYPGVKHLAIARGLGSQGIPASICAKQIGDPTSADYGYRPALLTITRRLASAMHGQCFPKQLPTNSQGQVECNIIEATQSASCNCDANLDRFAPPAADQCYVDAVQQDPLNQTEHWNCFCEIGQASGSSLTDCTTQANATDAAWCYVAASEGLAQATLVANCPSGEQQTIRFVGTAAPQPGATIFLACH